MSTELTLKISADTKGIKDIREVLKEIKATVGSTSKLSKSLKDLKRDSSGLKTSVAELSGSMDKLSQSVKKVTTTQQKLDKTTKKVTRSTRGLSDAFRGAAGASGKLWFAYGQLLPMMAGYAAASGAIKGLTLSAEFEAQTVFMNAVAEASDDYSVSLQNLQSELLGLKGLVHTPTELADASKELVKAGFSAAEAIKEIGDMSKASAVAQEDLQLVTKGVAKQYRAWGVSAVGAKRGVSSLAQTANMMSVAALSSATDFKELNATLAHGTELGSLSAASFSEILAAVSHMSNMGISGTKAMTSLRTSMLRLQNMSPGLKKSMKELKVPFDAFTESGDFKSLTSIFEDLGKSMQSLSKEATVELMDDIFNIRALKGGNAMLQAMAKSVDEGTFSFRALEEQIRAAGEQLDFVDNIFDKLSNTTKTQMDIMKAEISGTMIEAFSDSNGAVSELIQSIRELNNDGSLRLLIDGLAKTTELVITLAIQAVKFKEELIAIGVLYAGAKMVGGIYAIVTAIKAMTLAQLRFNVVAAVNPYVLAGGVLIGLTLYTKKMLDAADAAEKAKTSVQRFNEVLAQHEVVKQRGLTSEAKNLIGDPSTYTAKGGQGIIDSGVMKWDAKTKKFVEIKVTVDDAELSSFKASLQYNQDEVDALESFYTVPKSSSEDLTKPSSEIDSGGDPLDAVERAKWLASNLLSVQESSISNLASLRSAASAADTRLVKAQFDAQLISEESYFQKVRALNLAELDAKVSDAENLLELEQSRLATKSAYAKQFSDVSSLTDEANALNKVATAEVNLANATLERATAGEVASLATEARLNNLASPLKSIKDYVKEASDGFKSFGEITTTALQGTEDALVKFAETGKLSFKDLANSVVRDINRIIIKKALAGLVNSAVGVVGSYFGGGAAYNGGNVSNWTSSFDGASMPSVPSGRAVGGPVLSGTSYLIGEKGPEIFTPGTSGNVTPNHGINAKANSQPASNNVIVNQTINVDATGEQDVEARISQAVQEGAKKGYDLVLRDFRTRGPAYQGAKV